MLATLSLDRYHGISNQAFVPPSTVRLAPVM
jgi:hypothetical protein